MIRRLNTFGSFAYGGRFYDGVPNVLHVNVTTDIRTMLTTTFIGEPAPTDFDKHIRFHTVRYSLGALEDAHKRTDAELMGKLGIHTTMVDVKENRLMIGVDDTLEEAKAEILHELSRIGLTDKAMFDIRFEERSNTVGNLDFSANPVDMSNGAPDRVIDLAEAADVLIAPGSWLGQGSSIYAITGVSSPCTGFLYQGTPGFLSCGHGKTSGSKIFYQPVPSSGSYPSDLFNYNPANLTEIGTVVAVYWQSNDPYDCASIIRTNSSANMNPQNFCGGTIDGDTGVPEVGEAMAVCGCADGAIAGSCLANSATVTVDGSIVKTDMLRFSQPTTPGTSGGSVAYLDGETNNVNLTASVTSTNQATSHHAKYSHVKSAFNLTTIY